MIRVVCITAAAMVVAAMVGPVAGSASPRWPVCASWRQVRIPALNTFQARAVATVSPYEAWTVGNLTPDGLGDPIVLRWDGMRWVREPFPMGSRNGVEVNDIVAISPHEVWAVGGRDVVWGIPPKGRPMSARWDGSRWRFVPIEIPGLTGSLTAVARIGDSERLWAVGHVGHGRRQRPLAIAWDGAAWHRTPGPDIDRGPTSLKDVVSVGGHAWAVGTVGNPDWTARSRTLIERWNGTRWIRVASPDPGGRYDALEAVDASGSDTVWAAGSFTRTKTRGAHAMLLRWDGDRWRVAVALEARSEFRDLNVASPVDAWAVGEIWRRPLVFRRHGTPWRRSQAPDVFGWLTAIDGTPHNQWAAMVDMNGIEHQFGWTTSWHRC